jgi:hypothetical protein
LYQPTRKIARQQGRFVDLCPNAGKCDFSPDQKIGGEIIELDASSLGNIQSANLGSSDMAQQMRYEALQKSKQVDFQQVGVQQPQILATETTRQWSTQPQ